MSYENCHSISKSSKREYRFSQSVIGLSPKSNKLLLLFRHITQALRWVVVIDIHPTLVFAAFFLKSISQIVANRARFSCSCQVAIEYLGEVVRVGFAALCDFGNRFVLLDQASKVGNADSIPIHPRMVVAASLCCNSRGAWMYP